PPISKIKSVRNAREIWDGVVGVVHFHFADGVVWPDGRHLHVVNVMSKTSEASGNLHVHPCHPGIRHRCNRTHNNYAQRRYLILPHQRKSSHEHIIRSRSPTNVFSRSDVGPDHMPKYGMHCTPTKAKSPRFLKRRATKSNSHSTYFGTEIIVRARDTRETLHDFIPWQRTCLSLNHHACWMRVFSTVRELSLNVAWHRRQESFRHKACRSSEGGRNPSPRNGESFKSLGSSSATHHLQKHSCLKCVPYYGPNF